MCRRGGYEENAGRGWIKKERKDKVTACSLTKATSSTEDHRRTPLPPLFMEEGLYDISLKFPLHHPQRPGSRPRANCATDHLRQATCGEAKISSRPKRSWLSAIRTLRVETGRSMLNSGCFI